MTSIRDIAKIAGVSPASVSRILNNDPTFYINEAARGRVIEVAKKLHYTKADKKPGSKQRDSALSITLVMRYGNMREFNTPYFLNMHKGIDEEAKKWHLRVERPFKLDDPDKNWTDLANYGAVIIEGEMTATAIEQIQNINPNVIFLDVNTNIRGCNIYIGGKPAVVNLDGKIVLRKDDLREDGYIA